MTGHDQEAVAWALLWAGSGFVAVVILAYLWFAPEPPGDEVPEDDGVETSHGRSEGAAGVRTGTGAVVALRALGEDADALELDFRRPGGGYLNGGAR